MQINFFGINRNWNLVPIAAVVTCVSCSSKADETVIIKKNGLVEEVSIKPLYPEDELKSATINIEQIPPSQKLAIDREGVLILKSDVSLVNLNNSAFMITFEGPVLRLQPHRTSAGRESSLVINSNENSYGLTMLKLKQYGVGDTLDIYYFDGAKIDSREVRVGYSEIVPR